MPVLRSRDEDAPWPSTEVERLLVLVLQILHVSWRRCQSPPIVPTSIQVSTPPQNLVDQIRLVVIKKHACDHCLPKTRFWCENTIESSMLTNNSRMLHFSLKFESKYSTEMLARIIKSFVLLSVSNHIIMQITLEENQSQWVLQEQQLFNFMILLYIMDVSQLAFSLTNRIVYGLFNHGYLYAALRSILTHSLQTRSLWHRELDTWLSLPLRLLNFALHRGKRGPSFDANVANEVYFLRFTGTVVSTC